MLGADNQVIKSTLDESTTADYADLLPGLTAMARSMVRELDPLNDLEFLRVRSAKHEIMVAPSEWTGPGHQVSATGTHTVSMRGSLRLHT